MIDIDNVLILTQKEIKDARRNRWFLLYALAFAGLAIALAWLALARTVLDDEARTLVAALE